MFSEPEYDHRGWITPESRTKLTAEADKIDLTNKWVLIIDGSSYTYFQVGKETNKKVFSKGRNIPTERLKKYVYMVFDTEEECSKQYKWFRENKERQRALQEQFIAYSNHYRNYFHFG
jgi:hypothetical protein